jgi:hypothetical protein
VDGSSDSIRSIELKIAAGLGMITLYSSLNARIGSISEARRAGA